MVTGLPADMPVLALSTVGEPVSTRLPAPSAWLQAVSARPGLATELDRSVLQLGPFAAVLGVVVSPSRAVGGCFGEVPAGRAVQPQVARLGGAVDVKHIAILVVAQPGQIALVVVVEVLHRSSLKQVDNAEPDLTGSTGL